MPDLKHLVRQRDELAKFVKSLDDFALADLHRRAQHPARDAYGAGQPDVSVTASAELTSVERAADAQGFGRPIADPVLKLLTAVFHELDEVVRHAARMESKRKLIHRASRTTGRPSSLQGECMCCGRAVAGSHSDRLRSGYCEPCYRAWLDAGKPGSDPQEAGNPRALWEAERRAFLAQAGRLAKRRSKAS